MGGKKAPRHQHQTIRGCCFKKKAAAAAAVRCWWFGVLSATS